MKKIIEKFKRRREAVDSKPVSVPVEFRKSETADQRIARILDHSRQMELARAGFETFEEADDFNIPDDPVDLTTPWEEDFDYSLAATVNAGIVPKPDLSAERQVEIKNKIKNAPRKKRAQQIELEDAIAEGFKKAQKSPSDAE